MQMRVSFYVVTAGGSYVKLGSVLTVKNGKLLVVRNELGAALGIDGWNYVEVGTECFVEGPGLPAASIIHFSKDDGFKRLMLQYQSDILVNVCVPRVPGYIYVAPVEEEPVVVTGMTASPAESKTDGVALTEEGLMKLKKADLLEILGGDEYISKTKSELVSIILGKI